MQHYLLIYVKARHLQIKHAFFLLTQLYNFFGFLMDHLTPASSESKLLNL